MNCEIEFMPVGEGTTAGDAIVIRYGTPEMFGLMIVDGGTEESGEEVVRHVRDVFGENAIVSHVVLTHSDQDHASGLRAILRELDVRQLWMHLPWELGLQAKPLFAKKDYTDDGLRSVIKREYSIVSELFDIATERRIPVSYPFQGESIGPFRVLSPHVNAYLHLLPQFERTPEPDAPLITARGFWIGKRTFAQRIVEAAHARASKWLPERWGFESLRDGGLTSASNESSVVMYGQADHRRILLTGDAGLRALTWAANYAESVNLPLRQFDFVQVPHHGSRRNVGPSILDRLVGPKVPEGTAAHFSAYCSAPKDDETHPRNVVINAFTRRGALVHITRGTKKIWYGGFPRRAGYIDAEPAEFFSTVEAYD